MGKPGRLAVASVLPDLRRKLSADIVIANGENVAGGIGITPDTGMELFSLGVDILTLGNHAWAKREARPFIENEPRVVRPANYPPGTAGQGWTIAPTPAGPLAIAALQGRAFMDPIDDPFRGADALLDQIDDRAVCVFVDFHAEATSEKQAMGWHLNGRVSAVVGTHTHVQTADERILPGGTAYITDVGMTGPTDSVIGMSREAAIARFVTAMPGRYEPADGPASLSAVIVELDAETGRARSIERVQMRAPLNGVR